jgi:hypothetical protein
MLKEAFILRTFYSCTSRESYDSFLVCYYAGIGFGLAKKFLEAGDSVIICSRSGRVRHFVRLDLTEPKVYYFTN